MGIHVSSTDCKEWDPPPPPGGPGESNTEDCMVWDSAGDDLLLMRHVNTAFNCCPKYEATVDVVDRTILITEHEFEGLCSCLCLFDLGYEIDHLPPDVYQVIVAQEYIPPEEEPLQLREQLEAGTIPFWDSPSGMWVILGAVALGGPFIALLLRNWFTKGAHFEKGGGAGH